MMKIWGRKDGSNVIKVLWCLGEIGVKYERIDWGGKFGGNDDPEYRAKNPNGRLPTLELDDGFTLWESGAVTRYLCAEHSLGNLCPSDSQDRAAADKWMDWSSLNLAPFNRVFLENYFMLPPEQRDQAAIDAAVAAAIPMYDILEKQLADRPYLCGDTMTMAEIPAGSLTHRWLHWLPNPPSHPNVKAWYDRLAARPAYQIHVIDANEPRTKALPWRN
jgi:glutathione S-transferase